MEIQLLGNMIHYPCVRSRNRREKTKPYICIFYCFDYEITPQRKKKENVKNYQSEGSILTTRVNVSG